MMSGREEGETEKEKKAAASGVRKLFLDEPRPGNVDGLEGEVQSLEKLSL